LQDLRRIPKEEQLTEFDKIIASIHKSPDENFTNQDRTRLVMNVLNKLNTSHADLVTKFYAGNDSDDILEGISNTVTNGSIECAREFTSFAETAKAAIGKSKLLEKETAKKKIHHYFGRAAQLSGLRPIDGDTEKRLEILSQTNDKDLQNIYVEKTSEYKNDEMRTVAKGYYALLKDEDTRRQAVANSFTGESGDVQLKIQARQLEKAPTDSIVQEAHTEALGQGHIEQDAQQGFAKNIRLASNNLDEQNKEKVQKRLIDANINGCAPENQAAIYEDIVSNTDLVSVQEYAASNIYKLDESVRDWAE